MGHWFSGNEFQNNETENFAEIVHFSIKANVLYTFFFASLIL